MAPAPALANGSATATVGSQAAIIQRLTLVKTADLQFGTNVGGNTAGTVVVGPDGAVSSTGGVVRAGGQTSPAQFYAYSRRNATASLRLGANFINITRLGGGATMRVDNFTISSTPPTTLSTSNTTFTLNTPNGIFPFTIGATLHVGVHQMPGTYTGTFSVTMTYN
jgi:hypothetical protein